jgi:glutathione S-transferase
VKLCHSPTSPFVRKVMVLAYEVGLAGRIETVPTDAWSAGDDLAAHNPLSQVPTLVLDDGASLYDSPVICEYLDSLHAGVPRLPRGGDDRWRVLRVQALADGVMESAVAVFVERVRRPEDRRWAENAARLQAAIGRALDSLDARIADLASEPPHLGAIAVASALGYLDLRGAVGDWRPGRPALAAWFEAIAGRPSMRATVPQSGG